jgi:hypothetical protein
MLRAPSASAPHENQGDPMKRSPKKLKLAKETLLHLESEALNKAFGGFPEKTVNATYCMSNCPTNCLGTCFCG